MRIHVAILAAALAGHACAQWTSPPTTGAGVVYRTFWSPTAQATVSYHVSLPAAYGTDPAARFPVVYWLHGTGSPIAGIPALASWLRDATAAGASSRASAWAAPEAVGWDCGDRTSSRASRSSVRGPCSLTS